MTREDDVRQLNVRIEQHTDRIKELRAKRAMTGGAETWALDQEIKRHVRWCSIQERLRNLLATDVGGYCK